MTPPPPRPRKSLGQHFLTDPRILDRIVEALAPSAADTVIEIGPGRGALTERLVGKCARLVAVELDRVLAARLRERFAGRPDVTIVEGDVLDQDLGTLADGAYLLIGNVPYYITTPILFHALRRPRAARSAFLVQREVADRLVASPGSRDYGALSVNVQALARVDVAFRVPAGAFTPPPRVESAVVRLRPRPDPVVGELEEHPFSRFVIAAFALRRKQLGSIVRTIAGVGTERARDVVAGAGLDPRARPETLSAEAFAVLFAAVRAAAPSGDGS